MWYIGAQVEYLGDLAPAVIGRALSKIFRK